MRKIVDRIVIACLVLVIYHNWTDFPKQHQEVRGPLITVGVSHE
jgi:hypothetical protein